MRKSVSAIMLFLLLASTLTLAFKIQPVKSDYVWTQSIYIKADGTIYPADAPISTGDYVTYMLTDNIVGNVPQDYSAIIIERDNIIIDGAGYTLHGTGSGKGIDLTIRSNVTIKNLKVKTFEYGIYLHRSSCNSILRSSIADNWRGITLSCSSNNSVFANSITNNGYGICSSSNPSYGMTYYNRVFRNNITNNGCGISLHWSSYNSLFENNITKNSRGIELLGASCYNIISENKITANTVYGIYLDYSPEDPAYANRIFHNDFINNTMQVYSVRSRNVWDDSYPSGGNYWSDYTDVDLYSGLYQNETCSDGIWDHPYIIDANNQDRYPLVKPWATPASGKGIWIWRLSEAEGGNVSAIIGRCKKVGIKWIAIKCGDGTQFWDSQCMPSLITKFHNAGIKFLGWQYVYGDDPIGEAYVANKILDAGTDGLIIDAETEYEGKPDNATLYLEKIRKEHPESFLAYTTFPIIDYHLNFPYLEFGEYCDAVMPQDYWKEIGVTPEEMIKWMEEQWDKWHKIWKEGECGASIKPIIPIGQGWGVTGSEIERFCYLVYEHGYDGVSIWRYDIMSGENWEAYASTPIKTSTDTGIAYFRADTGVIKDLRAVNESDLPTEGKPNIPFPQGFFSFNISCLEVGGTVYVTIVFPENIPTAAQYWKYQEPEGWHQIPMLSNDGDSVVVIQLIDGGLGDDDAVTNGIIVDVGGVGYPAPPPTYSLTITTTAGGTTDPAPGTYSYTANSTVQVTAIPDTNYLFDHWELDTVNVGSANPYTVLMDNNHTLKAVFTYSPPQPSLSASMSPLSASILAGQSVTFTSTVSGGYTPYSYQWYLNGNPVSGATFNTWTFTPTTSGIYYVHLKVTDDKGNTAQSEIARITVATVPVGGYSIPMQLPTTTKPVTLHITLLTILTALFITIKQKTRRKHRQ